MNKKVTALQNSLRVIDELDHSISGLSIENSSVLSKTVNKLVASLNAIAEEGSTMEESSLLQIPTELFDHIDSGDSNNPELYLLKILKSCSSKSDGLSKRIGLLDQIQQQVSDNVEEMTKELK
jgi:hypothetical protein